MILVIDNYDSFTWNLVHYLLELGVEVRVERNDALTAREAMASGAEAFLISPGPCTPNEAGISLDLVAACAEHRRPLLGVCLGHQAIGQYFGGRVVRGGLMHGKTSPLEHDGTGVFAGLPSPFTRPAIIRWSSRTCPQRSRSMPPPPTRPSWACAIASCRSTASSSTPSRSPPSTATRCSPTF